jgi:hypothetical protein
MKTTKILGFMGFIPFLISFYLSIQSVIWQLESKQIFIAYSAIILSFIAGTIWEKSGQKTHDKQRIISNVFCLSAFIALLVNQYFALVILGISYPLLFLYETRLDNLNKQSGIIKGYLTMRLQLTVGVILLHIIAFIMW